MKSTICAAAIAAVATLTLASCGGGGGGGSPPTTEPPVTEPPPPEPPVEPEPEVPGTDVTDQMPDDDMGDTMVPPPPPPPRGFATLSETLETDSRYTSTVFDIDIFSGGFVEVPRTYIDIGNWGYSANGGLLFTATSRASGSITNGKPDYQSYFSSVIGSWSFSSPVEAGGSATWTGGVRGITEDYRRVEGDSHIQYHFGANLVDVRFDQFDDSRLSMQWLALPVLIGGFSYGLELDGDFYGANHEGVAGTFDRDDLRGVFGAVRE